MDDTWYSEEDNYQYAFTCQPMQPYKPFIVLKISIWRGRNISVGYYSDLLDTPDPQITISCESQFNQKVFKTVVRRNEINPEWNDHFTFVVGKETKVKEDNKWAKIKIDLVDVDKYRRDDFLGSHNLDFSGLGVGKSQDMTLLFYGHGEVDITVEKELRVQPDLRVSLGLCEQERNYRKMRKPKALEALQTLLGEDGPKNLSETPTISIASSGGGYRAMIASAGFIEALVELGVFDATMYFASLSGSSWYQSMAYMNNAFTSPEKMYECHDLLKKRCRHGLIKTMLSASFITKYIEHRGNKQREDRPITAVDIFGYAVGWCIFGRENLDLKLSETRYLVDEAKVPFHIISAVHVKDKLPVVTFNVAIEINPYEISAHTNGVHVPTEMYNSDWSHGLVIRDLSELPLHYHIGTAGSAFAILISHIAQQTEAGDDLIRQMEKLSVKLRLNVNSGTLDRKDSSDSTIVESRENDESVAESSATGILLERANLKESKEDSDEDSTDGIDEEEASILDHLLKTKGRGRIVERSAKVLNFMYRLPSLWKKNSEPSYCREKNENEPSIPTRISRKAKTLQMVDAGIACNVPAEHVIRKQRRTDVLIVLDAGIYKADGKLNHVTFFNVARNAEKQGLKFPKFNEEEVFRERFKELYVVEDENNDPECPIVLWFTIANGAFTREKNYIPVHGMPATTPEGVPFNKFPDNFMSVYKTMKFQYSDIEFDRLRELSRYNIMLNKQKMFNAIAKKIKEKRTQNK